MRKCFKWYILSIMFFLCLVIIPYAFSKYSTKFSSILTLNARQPEYDVVFYPSRDILPNEYIEVGYLETNGGQYINLGNSHPISTNTIVEVGTEFGDSWIYGYTLGDSGRYGGTPKSFYTGDANASWVGNTGYHDYVFNHSSGATIDETEYYLSGTPSGSSGTADVYLFRAMNSKVFVEGKIYYYRQYEGDTLVYDLIPCYRVSDNVAGMYDLISNTFFTNAGTGTFTTGYVTQHFVYGTAQNLTANTYQRKGYEFTGWNTEPDGSGIAYTDEQEVNNLTTEDGDEYILYAQWEIVEYDVIFKRNGLPIGYQEVEYIESTGTQYIDTGIIADDTTGVYAKISSQDVTEDLVYFGSRRFSRFWISSWSNRLYLLRNDSSYLVQPFNANTIFTIKMNYLNNRQYIYNDNVLATNIETLDDIPYSMYIFGGNNVGNTVRLSSIRMYEFIVTEDGDVIANYIPCYRISDGEIGLYDIENDEFHTNLGTGTFNKGNNVGTNGNVSIHGTMNNQHFIYGTAQYLTTNTYTKVGYEFTGWNTKYDGSGTSYSDEQEVNELTNINGDEIKLYAQWESIPYVVKFNPNTNNNCLPNGYQELEYIESTGTQYIDSGYKPTLNTGVEATFQFTDATTTQQRLFGVSSDTSVNDLLDFEFYINSTRSWGYAFRNNAGTGGWSSTNIAANTDKHTLYFNNKNDKTLFISNTTQVIYSKIANNATMTSSNYNIYIFARNYYNGSMVTGQYGKIKLYSFKIYEDGVIQMNFVPCFEISSGKAGLYDTIGNEFYPSSRENYEFLKDGKTYSQDFTYGTPQNLSANTFTREGYEFVEWNTESDGSGTSYTNQELVNNLTTTANGVVNLYAIWNQNSYTVNYYPNRTNTTYREVEYVESTGNQYINIEYYISGTTGIKAEYEYTSLTTQQRIFGTDYYQLYINGNGYYGYLFSNSTTNWKTNNITVDKGRHTVEFNKDLGRLKFDNGYLYNNANLLTGLTNTSTRPLGVMSYSGGSNKAKIKIYNFTLYESGETVSEFIPCYRLSDSTPGLCNITDNVFYPSNTSGMLKGDDILKTQLFTLNQSQNLNVNTYTRAGYIFNGWNTMPDGSGTTYTDEELINLNVSAGTIINLYAQWILDEAFFDGDNSSSILTNVTELTNIRRFEKYTGSDSDVETLISNGTAKKIDDGTTPRSIYAWNDNGTIYWWSDAYKVYLLDKSHYIWSQLTNAEYINVTGIDTSKVTTMSDMFKSTGYNATSFQIIGLNNFNTAKVTNMSYMFNATGYSAGTFDMGDIGSWNVSKVTNFQSMFSNAGYDASTWNIGDLSDWTLNTTNDVNMASMFSNAGYSAGTFNIGNIGSWNVSRVTNTSNMFSSAGYNASTWYVGDLSGWTLNTATDVDMSNMFYRAGYNATSWGIGDLSNWNTSNVTTMRNMFAAAGRNATTWTSIGTLKIYASDINSMFNSCLNGNGILNIYTNPTDYTNMFSSAATSGSGMVVNYTSSVTDIDNIIATKSSSSNVVKGSLLN